MYNFQSHSIIFIWYNDVEWFNPYLLLPKLYSHKNDHSKKCVQCMPAWCLNLWANCLTSESLQIFIQFILEQLWLFHRQSQSWLYRHQATDSNFSLLSYTFFCFLTCESYLLFCLSSFLYINCRKKQERTNIRVRKRESERKRKREWEWGKEIENRTTKSKSREPTIAYAR